MSQGALTQSIINAVERRLDQKQVSGSELARRLGVSQTYVWRRLAGEVSFSVADLERIADALEMPIDDLLLARAAA